MLDWHKTIIIPGPSGRIVTQRMEQSMSKTSERDYQPGLHMQSSNMLNILNKQTWLL
jgi:hypothetical protein